MDMDAFPREKEPSSEINLPSSGGSDATAQKRFSLQYFGDRCQGFHCEGSRLSVKLQSGCMD